MVPVLLGARVLTGLAIGLAMHAAPAYISETSPAGQRGSLVSLKEAFIVGGILLGYLIGFATLHLEGAWRCLYAAAGLPALGLLVGAILVPETPRFLDNAGQRDPAAAARRRILGLDPLLALPRLPTIKIKIKIREHAIDLDGDDDDDDDDDADGSSNLPTTNLQSPLLSADATTGDTEKGLSSSSSPSPSPSPSSSSSSSSLSSSAPTSPPPPPPPPPPRTLWSAGLRRPLVIGLGLMLLQQITGQPSVLYYAIQVFRDAGVSDPNLASVILGAFKLVATLGATALVDGSGRRPLLLSGVGLMTVALVVLGGGWGGGGAALLAILWYVAGYQVSYGPISWLMVSEIFPMQVRSQAVGLATMVNFGANFVVAAALPYVQAGLGLQGVFVVFTGLSLLAFAFIYLVVPETRGLSLEEIETMMMTEEE